MATSTTRLGLSKPDGADVVDIAVLNANADKLDIAAGAFICTSSTRPSTPWNGQLIYETDTFTALVYKSSTSTWSPLGGSTVGGTPPSGASKGDLWWDSDTGRLYVYYVDANSSQWVAASNSSTNTVGLVPIVAPTVSVSGGTATANTSGTVSFVNATSVSLNGVFSSSYTNYRVVLDFTGSSANTSTQLRIRKAGVDYTGAQYNFGGLGMRSSGTQTAFVGANQTAWSLSWINGPAAGAGSSGGTVDVFNPYGSTYQKIVATMVGGDGTSMAGIYNGGNCFSGQAANDGFTVQIASGTFTGTVTVYGYNS